MAKKANKLHVKLHNLRRRKPFRQLWSCGPLSSSDLPKSVAMSVSAFSLTLHGVTLVNRELILDSIRLNPLSSAKMISKSSVTDLCRIDEARDYIVGNLIILIEFVLFN